VRALDARYLGIRTGDGEILLQLMEETFKLMLAHHRMLQSEMIEWQKRHPGSGEQRSPKGVSTSASSAEKNEAA
jgi:hypothetical protein